MYKSNILSQKEYDSINNDLSELYALPSSIIKTSKNNIDNN